MCSSDLLLRRAGGCADNASHAGGLLFVLGRLHEVTPVLTLYECFWFLYVDDKVPSKMCSIRQLIQALPNANQTARVDILLGTFGTAPAR